MAASNIESSATGQRYVGSGEGASLIESASVRRRNRRRGDGHQSGRGFLGLGESLVRRRLKRMRQVSPGHAAVVEASLDGRLDQREVGRDVEIARCVERGMPD